MSTETITTKKTDTGDSLVYQLSHLRQVYDFCFTSDDRHILAATDIGEFSRIWAIPAGGGYPRLASSLRHGDVKRMKLSPDGALLAFTVDNRGSEKLELMVMSIERGIPQNILNDAVMTAPYFCWSPDSRQLAMICEKDGRSQLAVVDIDGSNFRWLTGTDDSKQDPHWSGDGKNISFTSQGDPLISHIHLFNLETGRIRNLTSSLEGENSGARFSPDGKTVGFTSDARGIRNVALVNIDREGVRWLENKNQEQTFLRWNPRGTAFIFMRNEEGQLTLQESNYPPSRIKRLTTAGFCGSDAIYGNTTDQTAIRMFNDKAPSDLYIRRDKTLRKLTESAPLGFNTEEFIEPKPVSYESSDGVKISALYYRPDTDADFPVLLWLHGGPTGQHFRALNPFIQLCVKSGIGVLAPDVRGSSGYGREFENLIYHDWGGGDLSDVAEGARFIRELENSPRKKLFVGGGSYGGYLSMMALVRHPEIWSAGFNWMGPVNLETLYYDTAPRLKPTLTVKYGFRDPDEDPTYYYNRSPINFIDRLDCPLLMIYGKNDVRVPIAQFYELRKQLMDMGKVYREKVLEDEGHSMNRTDSRILIYEAIIGFLSEFAKD